MLLGYKSGKEEQEEVVYVGAKVTSDTDISGYVYGAGAGLSLTFGKNMGGILKVGLDYLTEKTTEDGETTEVTKEPATIKLGVDVGIWL